MSTSRATVTALIAATTLALAGCASSSDDEVLLVGFAVPAEGNAAVAEAFNAERPGDEVAFATSYGASGDQSRAVAGGQPADLVHFSIAPDVDRLVDAGLVAADWASGPDQGMLTSSVVVLMVREGNPLGITDWEDLAREDVGIVTPNPGSSGAARWNVLAAWASVIQAGGTEAEAEEFLEAIVGNIAAFPGSGRDATNAFLDGTGDVLIAYENEAILGKQNGESFDYVVPDRSLLIENPAALTDGAPDAAREFLEYGRSPAGQETYAQYGFRPLAHLADDVEIGQVDGAADPSDPYPTIDQLATIDTDFGGWDAVVDTYFDADGIITGILERSGLS